MPTTHRLAAAILVLWHGAIVAQQFNVKVFGAEHGLPSATVDALAEDSLGHLWVQTLGGLCRSDGRDFELWTRKHGAPPAETRAALDPRDSTYRIVCSNPGPDPTAQCGLVDQRGNKWIGRTDGAYRTGPDGPLHLHAGNGLGHSDVLCMLQDRSGAIWMGTAFGGLARFTHDACINFTERDGLGARTVSAILRTTDGALWIGTSGGGLTRWDNSGLRWFGERDGLPDAYITCLSVSPGSTLLVGTAGHGLMEWTGTSFRSPTWAKALEAAHINTIRTADSTLWVATESGVFRSEGGSSMTAFTDHTEAAIDVLPDGHRTWVATEDGLAYLVDGKPVPYRDRDVDLPANVQVTALVRDGSGNIWAGTDGQGLWRFNGTKSTRFTTTNGLSSNRVVQVLLDADENVWAGTARGFDRLELDVLQERLLNVDHFGTADGFIGQEAFRNACFLDVDGTLWFGTVNGATRFDPQRATTIAVPPQTRITQVLLDHEMPDWSPWSSGNDAHGLPKELQLPYNRNHLTFAFQGLSLAEPEAVRYQYQLEGHDPDWSDVTAEQRAVYSNLGPGSYTFKVIARNSSGIWNEEPIMFTFSIAPPLWRTAGFLSVSGASLTILLFGFVRLRTRRLRRAAAQLEAMVDERTRELAQEKKRSDDLLLNILPASTAAELKEHGNAAAHHYEHCTVLFSDFKGFTSFSEGMPSAKLVAELDRFFRAFDRLCDAHRMEKIKTIGDAYMCAAGVPNDDPDHALNAARMALAMLEEVKRINAERANEGQEAWPIRIGLHSGPLTAGVVGEKKFAYDIWGGTVNLASRMESTGEPGRVNCSGATYALIMDRIHCSPRGPVKVKGKGEVHMYFVEDLRAEPNTGAGKTS